MTGDVPTSSDWWGGGSGVGDEAASDLRGGVLLPGRLAPQALTRGSMSRGLRSDGAPSGSSTLRALMTAP